MNWTLTDFDGRKTTGTSELVAGPLSRQTLPLTVNAPALGHYRLAVELRQGKKTVDALQGAIGTHSVKGHEGEPLFAFCNVLCR